MDNTCNTIKSVLTEAINCCYITVIFSHNLKPVTQIINLCAFEERGLLDCYFNNELVHFGESY